MDEFRLWEGPLKRGDVFFWKDVYINFWHTIYTKLAVYMRFPYKARPQIDPRVAVNGTALIQPLLDSS